MLRAVDKNNNFVLIDDADKNEMYFCPICNQPLIQKRGEIREHHFSHIGPRGMNMREYVPCSDTWHYDKTDWHIQWQKRFPNECYEKIVTRGNERHIADVLINDIVIEFQHSSISIDDFRDRNKFYASCGYKVIWVFDFIEEFEDGKISCMDYPDNEYRWTYVKKLFREIELKDEEATIFFQFSNEDEEGVGVLERVTNSYNEFRIFYTDLEHSCSIGEFVNQAKNNSFDFYRKANVPQITPEVISTIKDGKTIYELWSRDYSWMIVENLVNGKGMLIKGTNGEMWRERNKDNGKIVGKYSNKKLYGRGYTYSSDYVVWDAEKPIWRLIRSEERSDPTYTYRNVDDNDSKFSGCMDLRHIANQTNVGSMIVRCLFNNTTYMLDFVNAAYGSRAFNAYTIDLETGEIGDKHQNGIVMALFDKKVWIEQNNEN